MECVGGNHIGCHEMAVVCWIFDGRQWQPQKEWRTMSEMTMGEYLWRMKRRRVGSCDRPLLSPKNSLNSKSSK